MNCFGLVLLAFAAFMLSPPIHGATKQDYYNLYDALFASNIYKKEVRPAQDSSSVVDVFLIFHLLSLVDVDERQQTLVTSARLQMDWDDDYLSWDPTTHGNIENFLVPQKNIYLPDIVVANSVKAQRRLGYDELQVRLQSSGFIQWEPTVLLSTACDIDVTYFPFDTQICYIEFETAISKSHEIAVKLDTANSAVQLTDYAQSGQWELVDTSAENLSVEDSKTKLRFGLKLKRRRTFYLMNIIMPVFFLSLTSSLVFALPPDEGEKMGTGMTVLLAFAVYLNTVAELVPNTSLQVSILSLYLTVLLGTSAVSVIVCVFILRIHARDPDMPVGAKVSTTIWTLRRLMLMTSAKTASSNQIQPFDSAVTGKLEKNSPAKLEDSNGPIIVAPEVDEPRELLTWQKVALTLDKFCFILFSALTVVITVVCLLAIHFGGTINAPSLTNK